MINSDELPAGLLLFCSNCGHNISMHSDIEKQPISKSTESINSICRYDNGYFVCECNGFTSEKFTRILDTGQRNENIAVVEESSKKIEEYSSNKKSLEVSNNEVD